MQAWKRRVVALVAAGVGGTGLLMSSAGAQTPPPTTVPTFTIPEVPGFPDFTVPDFTVPDFTVPPPTMPPSTTVTTSPPPTMPPSSTTTISPPPTMPPPSVTIPADAEALVEDAISRLEGFGEEFSGIIEEIRAILDLF